MNQVLTVQDLDQLSESDGFRQFVVAVDRKEIAEALEEFAEAGQLLPAVVDDELAARVNHIFTNESRRRKNEDRGNKDWGDELVTSIKRFVVEKKAEIFSGEVPDWALDGKFTLFQRNLLADYTGADSIANHGDVFSVHPSDLRRYIKVQSFHRMLFAERVDEILRLVQSLCPKTIDLAISEAQYQELGGSGGLSGAMASVGLGSVDLEFKQSAAKSREAKFTEKYSRQPHAPSVPDDLRLISNTPEFKNLVAGRLNHYQLDSSRVFIFAESYGVDGKLSARAANVGLDFGANLDAGRRQEIKLHVEWWPMPDALSD